MFVLNHYKIKLNEIDGPPNDSNEIIVIIIDIEYRQNATKAQILFTHKTIFMSWIFYTHYFFFCRLCIFYYYFYYIWMKWDKIRQKSWNKETD
jgi:hypothetical protein